jgi:phenylacetate-coenzyme A ligase PaaK-like adenylate-forming protein
MLAKDIFSIESSAQFKNVALSVFKHQAKHNNVYHKFLSFLKVDPDSVETIQDIPFLPIQFFKTHKVVSNKHPVEVIFASSGTTGNLVSKHFITDVSIYQESYTKAFEQFYGKIEDYAILALLPSYLEREGSSLIYMVADLIKRSNNKKSGFYLSNFSELKDVLIDLENTSEKVMLIGVSFALLDLVEKFNFDLKNTIVMETGGMKGRRKELIRGELHELLKSGFGVNHIHSEYGMTELLSQAYSKGEGIFNSPPWMKILIRDPENAMELLPHERTGGINIIDLANINSCSFIATQDLGKTHIDGSFEVLGRFDHSDLRGCNLLIN